MADNALMSRRRRPDPFMEGPMFPPGFDEAAAGWAAKVGNRPERGAGPARDGSGRGRGGGPGLSDQEMYREFGMAQKRGGHPGAESMVHELARKAGIDIAREMQAVPPGSGPEAFQMIRQKALEAAASQAATDMELEAVEQVGGLWGLGSPFEQAAPPQQGLPAGPAFGADPRYERDLPEEMPPASGNLLIRRQR